MDEKIRLWASTILVILGAGVSVVGALFPLVKAVKKLMKEIKKRGK